MAVDFNFMVGGEAGQGVQSVGFLLAKVFARGGYHVFADQDYESRVRGGHNFFRIRVSDRPVSAIAETVDMLVALNKESIDLHRGKLSFAGAVVYDGETIKNTGKKGKLFSVPLKKLAGDKLMSNTVALGAALALVGYDIKLLNTALVEHFGKGKVSDANIAAAKAGYDYASGGYKDNFPQLKKLSATKRMLLTGNEAISLGAIAAGCKFMSAYPMTPASSIMEYFAAKSKDFNLVMVHAEDEIAAVNMAIGAAYAGVRAMTATSGSGLCLMVEGIGMAGITETPLVVVNAQRPGPAVGLPTRTEQGDLQFVLTAHHGDFPRAVLAPASVEDAFHVTVRAFNLAEKYQLPVIILTDQHLASSYATVDPFDVSGVTVERGPLFPRSRGVSRYRRHAITPSGISPRAFPGVGRALVVTDADEHDETGHLTEDSVMRTEQVQKRMRKQFGMKQELSPPMRYGPKRTDTLLIGWGSAHGAIREAADILQREGSKVSTLHLNELWPFPAEVVVNAIGAAHHSYIVESNATGQLARLIRAETGKELKGKILKFDGRPLTPGYIVEAMKKEEC